MTAIEHLEQRISAGLDELIGALKTGIYAAASMNLMAARIQSAKTDHERNEAIKEGKEALETMRKSMAGESPPGTPWPYPLTRKSL